jgi:hypothetical protein
MHTDLITCSADKCRFMLSLSKYYYNLATPIRMTIMDPFATSANSSGFSSYWWVSTI